MSYPQTEQNYWHDAVVHQYEPSFTNEEVVVPSGANAAGEPLKVLTLLGKVTATNEYVPLNPAGGDGSQEVAGILYSDDVDASTADAKATVMVRGPAIVIFEQLVLVNALNEAQTATAKAQLLALNIKSGVGI